MNNRAIIGSIGGVLLAAGFAAIIAVPATSGAGGKMALAVGGVVGLVLGSALFLALFLKSSGKDDGGSAAIAVEDCGDISINDTSTTANQLISGRRFGRLDVANTKVGQHDR